MELATMVVEGAEASKDPQTRSDSIQNGDVTRDMIEQMLTLLNGGIPVQSNGCNCGPGEPHTCMTPADSRSPLRGTSRQESASEGAWNGGERRGSARVVGPLGFQRGSRTQTGTTNWSDLRQDSRTSTHHAGRTQTST